MEIRERQSGDVAIVELAGRLTINDEPGQLKEAVASAVKRGAVTRQGGRLKLVGTPDRIVELLALAGLDGIFERHDSEDEAVKSF
jgi:hypothetical protein